MIAMIQRRQTEPAEPIWHARFLGMLPIIRRQAKIAFRGVPAELRTDLIQEVVANCLTAYALLVRHGKENVAYPSALARYAVLQVRAGRRVGNRLNTRDALSPYAQHCRGFVVERLDSFNEQDNSWHEIVTEDERNNTEGGPPAPLLHRCACRADHCIGARESALRCL
jgi:hypothetical protein